MKRILLLPFIILQFYLPVFSQSVIRLDNPTTIQNIALSVDFLEDTTSKLTLSQVTSVAYLSKFQPSKQENPQLWQYKIYDLGQI
jgi:hypothetical protein